MDDLNHDPVEIAPADPGWPRAFEREATQIHSALGAHLIKIEHIGSTAVPGLAAKPVIDIQVGVRSLDASGEIVASMETLGYEYLPELEKAIPDRRYFRRVVDGHRTHQVHLVERENTDWWDRHIAFRDWLRSHTEDREAYEMLKRRLAAIHPDDRMAYTEAKTTFVEEFVRRAGAAQ